MSLPSKVDHRPWVERYRPSNLSQVSHQTEVIRVLQNAVATGRLPHLLLYGPPGSGKTSVALALCRQLWAPGQWKQRVLELNASDERGISVVRDKIKHFASLAVSKNSTATSSKSFFKKIDDKDDGEETTTTTTTKLYPNPPFKIIILDEADTVTPDAQAALRRIIEAHSHTTRFILICNYVTRIIEPLASRCAKFRFTSLPSHSMKERLLEIAHSEQCDVHYVDSILKFANGDMRRAVTTLQSMHALGTTIKKDDDNDDDPDSVMAEVAGLPPTSIVDDLWNHMTTTKSSSNNFDTMNKSVEHVIASGFSAQSILPGLLDKVIDDGVLDETSKSDIAIRLAEAEKNMIEGADEYLQLLNTGSLILNCSQKKQPTATTN